VQGLPATSGNSFTVSWSGASPVDVQFLDTGRGGWRDWLRQYPGTSGVFSGVVGRRYSFRCQAAGSSTYPANPDTTTTTGAISGLSDIVIASLTAEGAPGGGLLATVTIRNQGTVGTQRGFFVDLYRDHKPGFVGDYDGSVYLWVNEPLAAGATRTLKAALTTEAGQANLTLYAQADSSGMLPESDESNNIFPANGVAACLAAEDQFEPDDSAAAAGALAAGASQTRNLGGPGDQDWLRLSLAPGRLYRLTTSGLGANADTRLALFDATGARLFGINDDSSATSLASQALVSAYFGTSQLARVDHWNPGAGGCSAGYNVSLADLGPAHHVFLPVARR
jgi:hypothetical protein